MILVIVQPNGGALQNGVAVTKLLRGDCMKEHSGCWGKDVSDASRQHAAEGS